MATIHPNNDSSSNNNDDNKVNSSNTCYNFLSDYCCKPSSSRYEALTNLDIDFCNRITSSAIRAQLVYRDIEYVCAIWEKAKTGNDEDLDNIKASDKEYTLDIKKRHFNELIGVIDKPIFFSDTKIDAQVYLWCKDNVIYITFRGTSSIKDAFADLNFVTKEWKDKMYIHTGIYNQFLSLESKITNELKTNPTYNLSTIVISGHSLGAALCQIASAIYADMFTDKKIISHAYGCPRIGNIKMKRFFESNVKECIRIANKRDPIAAIPQRSFTKHCAKCLVLYGNNSYKMIDRDDPWYMRLKTSYENIDLFQPTKEHDIQLYVERLEQVLFHSKL